MKRLAPAIGFALVLGISVPAASADLTATSPVPMARPSEVTPTDDYLRREALLLQIREHFSLLDADGVRSELAQSLDRHEFVGPSENDQIALDRALLAEGSYYLVSLRYLILAGGAAWPTDRPARSYENDAIVTLEALQERLFESVATRSDPLPIFLEAQRIWALTEGYVDVPEHLDVFGHRDELVEEALASQAPASAST